MKMYKFFLPALFLLSACGNQPGTPALTLNRDIFNRPIYEVNIRQFSPEGNFKAVTRKISGLKELGVGTLWLMPVNPIGVKNRKGSLGSYYSIRDYYGINPEFGTEKDFEELVREAHRNGMPVIIDWVANHTAWDNPLIAEHPEWYTTDSSGKIISPVPDWSDVADLNYEQKELREYMIGAMLHWIKKYDIDGFRCDVAEMVPLSFWREAVSALRVEKNVLMLAEGENPELHRAGFNLTYSWKIYHTMNAVASGRENPSRVTELLKSEQKEYPPSALRLRFITNHDENSWNGTVFERFGNAVKTFTVFYLTLPGVPLVYTGQEYGLSKRLRFFDKDTVNAADMEIRDLFRNILSLRENSPAASEGDFSQIPGEEKDVFAYFRTAGGDSLLIILNFSGSEKRFNLPPGKNFSGIDISGEQKIKLSAGKSLDLKPYTYRIIRNID
jgi:glycosidase